MADKDEDEEEDEDKEEAAMADGETKREELSFDS